MYFLSLHQICHLQPTSCAFCWRFDVLNCGMYAHMVEQIYVFIFICFYTKHVNMIGKEKPANKMSVSGVILHV